MDLYGCCVSGLACRAFWRAWFTRAPKQVSSTWKSETSAPRIPDLHVWLHPIGWCAGDIWIGHEGCLFGFWKWTIGDDWQGKERCLECCRGWKEKPLVRYKNRNEQIHHRLPSDWTGKKWAVLILLLSH